MNIGPAQDATWSARKPVILGLIVLTLLVGGFGGWAVYTSIAGAIISGGQIEVDQNRQVIQHLDGGIVDKIYVSEGDAVSKGDILIQLDGTQISSELTIVEGQLFELMARRARLEAERDRSQTITPDPELTELVRSSTAVADLVDGQRRLFEAREISLSREVDQLNKRRAQIGNQIDGIKSQQNALSIQLGFIQEELKDKQQLMSSGLVPKGQVLSLQREEARLSGTLGELTASEAESLGRITELEIEILTLENTRQEDAISQLRDIRYREYELAEQRRALKERLSRLSVRAPVSGIVYGMEVFAEQSVIRAADPLLFLIPQDRPLVIASKVEPIHIDQVFPGQDVMLRFSSLDSRTTPELSGKVMKVSADAFQDESRGTSFYRAEIILQEGELDRLPEGIHLLPGMPVETFLKTSDRTPLAYLIKPFTDYFVKAFREG